MQWRGISSWQWGTRGEQRGVRPGTASRWDAGPYTGTKPPGRDDRGLCREKPKGFILRPSVRKGLWSKFNHLTAFLKVKQRLYDLLYLGKHLKKKEEEVEKKSYSSWGIIFVFTERQGKTWEDSGRREWKGAETPASPGTGETVVKSSCGFWTGLCNWL